MRHLATLKYDLVWDHWVAVYDLNTEISGMGEDPEEAGKNLASELSKHDLWVKP